MEQFQNLREIIAFCWSELSKAPNQKRHPWRSPVMANQLGLWARVRVVILRKANERSRLIRSYTDLRAGKVANLYENSKVSWLFYHPRKQVQIRVRSEVTIAPGEVTDQLWSSLPVPSRAAYAAQLIPGTKTDAPTNALADDFFERDLPGTDYARENFLVLDATVTEMEVLQLHRAGHRRALFTWQETNQDWESHWLVP